MDTVDIQWPNQIQAGCDYKRGFGVCHRKFAKFTPVAHWQQTENQLTQVDKDLGPNSAKKEAEDLALKTSSASQEATQQELKLNAPIPKTNKKKKEKKNPPETFSIFNKKHLKTI